MPDSAATAASHASGLDFNLFATGGDTPLIPGAMGLQ
jgi:hypothetical protein